MVKKNPIIAFSGVDGAGKSTQIDLLETYLHARGARVVRFWARGGYTPLFSHAKRLVRRLRPQAIAAPGQSARRDRQFGSPWIRRLWLTLAILDLGLCYGGWLRWRRFCGWTVLCDRFLEDSLLDFRRNFPAERVEEWGLWHVLRYVTPVPDIAFVLLLPVEESQRRCRAKAEPYPDTAETLAWRLFQYERMAREGQRVPIDARTSVIEVHREVLARIPT